VWDQIVEFVNALPAMWEELTTKPAFQDIVSAADFDQKVRKALGDLAAGLPEAADALLGIAGGVFGSVLSLVTLTFLSLFLLMERPAITEWLFGFTAPQVERRWHPVVEDSISAVSSSLIGNVAISIVAATVAGVSAWAFGLPFPLVLAVITGLLDLIPQVGATVAAVILVLVALTVSTEAAIAMAIIQLIYQQLENYVVYPIVYRRAVELSGFTTIVAVLIAGSLLGVVGAILAVPFAAVIKVVLHEAGAPRRARMATLRGPEEATAPIAAREPGQRGGPASRRARRSSIRSSRAVCSSRYRRSSSLSTLDRFETSTDTTTLVSVGMRLSPVSMSTPPTMRPGVSCGTTSPYPTVVTVSSAYQ
jgi:predicted PurR-regulated permease PerM